jgi:hypothetical protein
MRASVSPLRVKTSPVRQPLLERFRIKCFTIVVFRVEVAFGTDTGGLGSSSVDRFGRSWDQLGTRVVLLAQDRYVSPALKASVGEMR